MTLVLSTFVFFRQLYRGYVALEQQLGEVERCRSIYSKWLECSPTNCAAWARFAELEATVGEAQRARAVYELAISQVRRRSWSFAASRE